MKSEKELGEENTESDDDGDWNESMKWSKNKRKQAKTTTKNC